MDARDWVAVIDDDASVRRSLGRVLTAYGVGVGTFCSAEEYLQNPAADPPQCIVVDVQLAGGMSGLELVARLAADAASPTLILMTGLDIAEAVIRLHGARIRWLRKPFDSARLIALLPMHVANAAPAPDSPTPAEDTPQEPVEIDSRW